MNLRPRNKELLFSAMMRMVDEWLTLRPFEVSKREQATQEFKLRVAVAQKVLSCLLGYVEGVALLVGIPEDKVDEVRRNGRVEGMRTVAEFGRSTVTGAGKRLRPLVGVIRRLTIGVEERTPNRSCRENRCPDSVSG